MTEQPQDSTAFEELAKRHQKAAGAAAALAWFNSEEGRGIFERAKITIFVGGHCTPGEEAASDFIMRAAERYAAAIINAAIADAKAVLAQFEGRGE